MSHKCAAKTRNRRKCKNSVQNEGDFCKQHSPEFKKARAQAARTAGYGQGKMKVTELPDTKPRLAEFHAAIIVALANGEINHNMANALSSAVTKQWKFLTELGDKFTKDIEGMDLKQLLAEAKELIKNE